MCRLRADTDAPLALSRSVAHNECEGAPPPAARGGGNLKQQGAAARLTPPLRISRNRHFAGLADFPMCDGSAKVFVARRVRMDR